MEESENEIDWPSEKQAESHVSKPVESKIRSADVDKMKIAAEKAQKAAEKANKASEKKISKLEN